MNWIDFSKTLREQGIDESEPVLLRRKFFFSDGNIDSHDPVQLNLLYVQVRSVKYNLSNSPLKSRGLPNESYKMHAKKRLVDLQD